MGPPTSNLGGIERDEFPAGGGNRINVFGEIEDPEEIGKTWPLNAPISDPLRR